MTRLRLPDRHPTETVKIEHDGHRWHISVGRFSDGRAAEVFAAGSKVGSEYTGCVHDAMIFASLLMQHDVSAAVLAKSVGRCEDGQPTSIVGKAIDMAAELP